MLLCCVLQVSEVWSAHVYPIQKFCIVTQSWNRNQTSRSSAPCVLLEEVVSGSFSTNYLYPRDRSSVNCWRRWSKDQLSPTIFTLAIIALSTAGGGGQRISYDKQSVPSRSKPCVLLEEVVKGSVTKNNLYPRDRSPVYCWCRLSKVCSSVCTSRHL